MKRKAGVAVLLTAVIISSSFLVAENYFYSPFHNSWTGRVAGNVISTSMVNGSVYIQTVQSNPFDTSFNYGIYMYNLTTGTQGWFSRTTNFTSSFYLLAPSSQQGSLMNFFNNTIYLMALNGTTFERVNNGNSEEFEVLAMNASTGAFLHSYILDPFPVGSTPSFGITMNMIGNTLYLGFINSNNTGKNFLAVYVYSIGSNGPILENSSYTAIPGVSGWGTNSESVYIWGTSIAYCLNQLGLAVIYGPGGSVNVSMPGQATGFNGRDLYYGNTTGGNFTAGYVSMGSGETSTLFGMSHSGTKNVSYEYTAETDGAGIFYIVSYAYPYGTFTSGLRENALPSVQVEAINSTGFTLWTHFLLKGYDETMVMPSASSNGNIMLYTMGQSSSEILILSNETGKTQLDISYNYIVDYNTGSAYPLTPPIFRGILLYSGNYVVYWLGSEVALAEIK